MPLINMSPEEKIKVLHIELGKRRLGGSMQVFYLAREMKRRQMDIAVVCPDQSPLHSMCEMEGIPVFPVRYRGDLDLSLIPRLIRMLSDYRPGIVHIHSRRGADTLGAFAARLAGEVKVVVSRRVDNPVKPGIFTRIRYGWLCDRIVAVSGGIVKELVRGGIPEEKISLVYSAVEASDFQVRTDAAKVRADLGLDLQDSVVAVIAQLIDRKGHRFLLRGAPAILARHNKVKFLLLGEGETESKLRNLSRELDIEEHVIFAGYRDNIGEILSIVDVLVHPATMEGFANCVLQAMAAQVPVVATSVGGMPESVLHGINGILVPPRDSKAIADAVIELLNDASLRKNMGAEGRRIVEDRFNVKNMVDGNLALYFAAMKL